MFNGAERARDGGRRPGFINGDVVGRERGRRDWDGMPLRRNGWRIPEHRRWGGMCWVGDAARWAAAAHIQPPGGASSRAVTIYLDETVL